MGRRNRKKAQRKRSFSPKSESRCKPSWTMVMSRVFCNRLVVKEEVFDSRSSLPERASARLPGRADSPVIR